MNYESNFDSEYSNEVQNNILSVNHKDEYFKEKNKCSNLFKATVMSLGGAYFGFYIAIFNPMGDPLLKKVYKISDENYGSMDGNMNLYFSLGALFCVLLSGPVSDKIGRHTVVFIGEILALITYYGYTVKNIYILQIVRFFGGIIAGINTATAQLYIKELMP